MIDYKWFATRGSNLARLLRLLDELGGTDLRKMRRFQYAHFCDQNGVGIVKNVGPVAVRAFAAHADKMGAKLWANNKDTRSAPREPADGVPTGLTKAKLILEDPYYEL